MNGHATINRLYRLVWSDTLGAWVAVAENTRGRGKRSGRGKLLAALFAGVAGASLAQAGAPPAPPAVNQLPVGGQVVGGVVDIGQQGATMTVTQASQRGAIDWQSFNVGSGARVQFVQPSASAVTLNRVLDTQASQIYGRIDANGQVFLSNPNGVYFSATASVDVGALVATTHAIDNAAFMAGGATFLRQGASGSVVNDGQLTAGIGGYIALLAPAVRNNGVVLAQAGTVALASGEAISLQFDARQSLVGVLATPSQIDALVENGNAVRAPGGLIVMSAQAARQLQDGVVRNSGTLEASGLSTRGGKIVLDASGLVDNSGVVAASSGGLVAIAGERMLNTGAVRADGGGSVNARLGALVETTGATVSATGGAIAIDSGAGQLFSSGSYDASGVAGQAGGSVTLTGATVTLMGAHVDASGDAGGGSIRVGGDFHGANALLRNATSTTIGSGVTLAADARVNGNGGSVVVWSDVNTTFAGSVSARGGAAGGNGGQLEVSGKQDLHFAGSGDAHAPRGAAGTLLLDPKDIYIDADLSGQKAFVDPHSSVGGTFGAVIAPLTTTVGATVTPSGYVAITNPTDDFGATNAGATYLFRSSDQALVSTLYGSHVNDRVGSGGVRPLDNGNFVVISREWNGGRGAVTWGNGTTGWGSSPTAVSSSNSLVGSLATFTNSQGYASSDGGNANIVNLANGNYVVTNGAWNNNRGAVTFGNGATGVSGVISASNSLVGSTANSNGVGEYVTYKYGDNIGSVQTLPNGNYVVVAPSWNKGVGAIALGSGTSGLVGTVGASTALVGDSTRFDATGNGNGTDLVGYNFTVLTGSQFLTYQSLWNHGAGAVTEFDGFTPIVGLVSATNSKVGAAGDALGTGGLNILSSKNAYILTSPNWNGGRGAVTWVPFASNIKDLAIAANGITGAAAGDAIGSRSVTVLANQDYVVASPSFNGARGAATLVDGSTGLSSSGQGAVVSTANSVVGSQANDQVSSNGILPLTGNGNFLVLSPYWANGGATKAGAVTWSSGSSPTVGAVSTSNSLVGSASNDRIGSYSYNYYGYANPTPYVQEGSSVTALANGNYAVASPMFNGTRGAVTWGNGATGATVNGGHTVTAANSLLGSSVGDFIGGYLSPVDVVTNTTTNATSHYDAISNAITGLSNGNFVTANTYWNNGSTARVGAVSWSDGAGSPTIGAVSASNSLVGSSANDMVGMGNYQSNGISLLQNGYDSIGNVTYSGNYVITSSFWNNGSFNNAGAVTWGSGTAALTGTISNANSVLGLKANDVSGWSVVPLAASGNYLIQNPNWNNGAVLGAGAISFVDGSSGRLDDYAASGNTNQVSAANSLVGSHADDHVGAYVDALFAYNPVSKAVEYTGNYVALTTQWDNGSVVDVGAVTWGSGASGVKGVISSANSLLGVKAYDGLGNYYATLYNGNYTVANPTLDVNGVDSAGAVSWVNGNTGRLNDYAARGNQNIMSVANALVGSHPFDYVGTVVGQSAYYAANGYEPSDGGYFVVSNHFSCMAGAVTFIDNAHSNSFIAGVVGPSNSAVGNPNGNMFGGLDYYPNMSVVGTSSALVNFLGGGGHVVMATTAMPAAAAISVPGATGFADAADASVAMTPDYIAGVLRTGTNLTLQANNDIYVKSAIDASGGVAGGALTMRAGRSIAVLGDIITGNRDLTLVANDTLANGVQDGSRDSGVATISMGKDRAGNAAIIDAGSGAVAITMAAGLDKTNHDAGSIGINSISGATIKVVNNGNGASAALPTLDANCCGFDFGYRATGADLYLDSGAVLRASASGNAVILAASERFINSSGNAGGTIVTADPGARWLVYANAPGTSTFANLDSGNTAVWHASYTGTAASQAGNRYVFQYQPVVTVGTQNVVKTYGDDVSASLTASVVSLSGAQAAQAGAYLGDTVASALAGTVVASSAGAAASAGVASGPYAITVDLSGVTGNNGYAVALGSGPGRTLTVNKKALTVTANDAVKVYDGSAYHGGNGTTISGFANGETAASLGGSVSYGGTAQGAINAGTYSIVASGYSSANYSFSYVNGQLLVNARALVAVTADLVGTISKVYDGNTVATLGSGNFSLSGFADGEGATVTRTVGTYDSRNAGARVVTATLSNGDFIAQLGTQLSNYTLPTTASGVATITARPVTLTAPTVSKTYDGSVDLTASAGNLSTLSAALVGGDAVTAASMAFTDRNAGAANRTVALSAATINDGNNGANYSVTLAGNSVSTISPRVLTVNASGSNRSYDGGVAASVSLADDRVPGDVLTVSEASATFANKNAGLAKTITVTGIGKSGRDAGNYTVAASTITTTADIARAQLQLAGVSAVDRVYDTGTSVMLSGTPTVNALGGDVVAILGSGVGTLANKNVGTGKAITVAGYTISDTNYDLLQPASLTVNIAPAVLALGGLQVASTKTYDGSRAASLAGSAVVSGLNGEVVSVLGSGSGQFADANAGGGKAVTVAGFTASDSNYVIGQQPGLAGSIAQAPLTVTIGGVNKVYDGSSSAVLVGGNYSVAGLVGGQGISVDQAAGSYDSRNAGARTVSASLAGGNYVAASGTLLSNYVLPASASGSGLITPRSVTLGAPAISKVYDGTTGYSTSGADLAALGAVLVGGDSVSAAAFSFTDKNAGAGNRGVTLNSATVNDGNNGANYSVTLAGSSVATITPRTLHVTATASNRVYDAGLDAQVSLADDRVVGDVLTLSDSGAAFLDKNAGLAKTIVVSGLAKAGLDSANYVLAGASVSTSADIARAPLTVTGVSAVGRDYDSALAVALSGTPVVQALGADVVVIGGGATASVANKNAGSAKAVTVAGYTTVDNNYYLIQPQGLTVDITPAVLALGGLQVASTKTYDGSRAASLAGSAVVSGLNGEVVSVLGSGSGQFADANAGGGKAVTVAGFTASDSNYVIGQQPGLAGSIAQAPLTVTIGGVNKVYDGSSSAVLVGGNYSVAGLVGGQGISVDQAAGSYDSRNAGARTVSASLAGGNYVAASGTLLSNYVLPASASGSGLITPRSVTLGAPAISKVYDGTTGYSTSGADLAALGAVLVGGDSVSAAAFSFTDKNAGAGNRGVTLNSATVNDGNNGANYSVTLAGSSVATITPRTLHVTATASNRVYDAGLDAQVSLADDRVAGDLLTLSDSGATFLDKNAGTGKTVLVSGIGKAGGDSANYVLASNAATTSADIARADLVVSGVTAEARAYDGGVSVAIAGVPLVHALGDDVVTVSGGAVGTLADKHAGQGKQVAVSGYRIDDANYRLVAPAGVTVDIAPAVLALHGLTVAASKTYDGSRSVTLTGSATVTGLNGETVSVLGTSSGLFADKNVGNGKAISVAGLQASDSNYVIGQQAGLTGNIVPLSLAVTGLTANDKLFDGLTGATLAGSARVNGVAGDALALAGTPLARFASADPGVAKPVAVIGYALTGADAGNYLLLQPAGLTATINNDAALVPAPLVLAAPALPTPPLTVQIADTAPVPAPAMATSAAGSAGNGANGTNGGNAVNGGNGGNVGNVGNVADVVKVSDVSNASNANNASNGGNAGNGGASGIVVALVRAPVRTQGGLVTVSVPAALATGAAGFTFPLPAALVEAAAASREQVVASTTTGSPLPSWLTYDNGSKTFTATAAPAGSLPMRVLLTIGVQQAVIEISQSGE